MMRKRIQLIKSEKDPLNRFAMARGYLDESDADSIDVYILETLLNDDCDLIRSEAADFALISGVLGTNAIEDRIDIEDSEIVYPRLWLALARADSARAKDNLNKIDMGKLSLYEKCYFDAAMFIANGDYFYLYDLCALACSKDLPASHSALDLLQIVAGERIGLLRELTQDLERQQADNAEKARNLFVIGESGSSS